MKMTNEIHWRFESMGEPTQGQIGFGTPKAMSLALIHWLVKTPMHRRMQVTIAKSQEELYDRRVQRAEQVMLEMQTDMDAIFAEALAGIEGVE